jgi:tetratricopeptide (TPR) repeat protein
MCKIASFVACGAMLTVLCRSGHAQAFSCPSGTPSDAVHATAWLEAHSIGTVAEHVHDSLAELGYRFPNPLEAFGTHTSEAKWTWPTVMAFDGWRHLIYPGAIVTITLEPVDVWTHIRIETRLLCKTNQSPPDGAITRDFEWYVLQRTDLEVTSAIRNPLYHMPIDVLGSSCSVFSSGDPKIRVCEAIAKNNPESPRAQFEYALSLIEFYHAERAWKPLERYFELAGEDLGAYQFAGLQMLATSKYDEAKKLFDRALRLWPHDPVLHYGLGRAEAGRGREKQALESFRRAIELDSSFAEAFYYAAAAYEAREEMEDAQQYCQRALHQLEVELAARQAEVEVWLMLAHCYATLGEHEHAVASFYRAYEVDGQVTASNQAVITAVKRSFEIVGEQPAAPLPGPVVAKVGPSRLARSYEPRGAMQPATSHAPGGMYLIPPAEIDQFRLVVRDTVANTPHYKYEGPNIVGLDVFVWEATDTNAAALERELEQQVADYQLTLPVGVERGWYESYEVGFAEPKPVTVLDGIVSGHVVAVGLHERGEVNLSFFYVYAVRGHFVKVRLTIPGTDWTENEALDFPEAVVRYLANKR